MLEISREPGRSVIILKELGIIQTDHYLEFLPELKELVDEIHPTGLLLDWTQLNGWNEESESVRFYARLDFRSYFERIAILADEGWGAEISRVQEVMHLPVRHYPTSDRQAALAWLDPGTS